MATDHIAPLLKVKRDGRERMVAARDRCRTLTSRAKWTRWIKKNDEEIAALESVQQQIAVGLRFKKLAHGVRK